MVNNEESLDIDIDCILSEVGFGKFQVINFAVIFAVTIISTLGSTSYIFTARDTSYRCLITECESNSSAFDQTWLSGALPFEDGVPNKCERYPINNNSVFSHDTNVGCEARVFDNSSTTPCSGWIYGEGDTIVKGLDIPCEDWKRSLVGTINSAGQLVSLLFSGILSDKYGRRNVMIIMTATSGIFGLIQSFSPNYWFFLTFEFLNLAASSGGYSSIFIMAIEILQPHQRTLGSAIIDISYSVAALTLGFLAWATPSWRSLLRVVSIPAFFVLLSFFAIPECFRWLNSKGRKRECVEILKKAAHMNNVILTEKSITEMQRINGDGMKTLSMDFNHKENENLKNVNAPSVLIMLKTPHLLLRLIIGMFIWFTNVLVFYGLSLNSVNISGGEGNVYINYIYVTLIEIPGIIAYVLLLRYVGRKKSMFYTLMGSGIFCVVFAVTPNMNETIHLMIYLLGKLCIVMSFSMAYIVTSELFPTTLRNSSINICSVFGRLGGALAPQVPLLQKVHRSLPMAMYGIFPIFSAFLVLALPETKDTRLPDTIEEAKQLK